MTSAAVKFVVVSPPATGDREAFEFIADALREVGEVELVNGRLLTGIGTKDHIVVAALDDVALRLPLDRDQCRTIAMVLRPDRLTTERRQIRPNVTLCCAPSWFLPPLIALPEPTVMCGFLPQSVIDPPPIAPALLEFLENGKAPILFINHHGPIDHQLARQACRQLGRRGVFIGENLPRSDDRFFCCEHAPLIKLLPWVLAIVHEGRMETCAAALSGGVPQLICSNDTRSARSARHLRQFGFAECLSKFFLGTGRLYNAIEHLLDSDWIAARCTEAANAIRRNDPRAEICRAASELVHGRRGVLSMSSLGDFGRFGNQIFQYAFLRILGKTHGYDIQTRKWCGEDLFGHRHARPKRFLRPGVERNDELATMFDLMPEILSFVESRAGAKAYDIGPEALAECPPDLDLIGNFWFHTRFYAPYKEFFRQLFEPTAELRAILDPMMAKLRQRGKTIVAIHSRRGDFARLPLSPFAFTVTPQRWREWLSSVWGQLDEPVLYIASDEPQLMNAALAEFKPMTAGDLGVALPSHIAAHGFFIDHYVLSHADVVGISCSSFSFSACMLNRNARLFVRATGRYENYWETMDPWNAMPFPIFSKGRLRRTFREAFEVARSTLGWREALSAMLWYAPQEVLSMYLSRAMLAFFADGLRGPLLMTLANLFAWFDSSFERVDPRRPRGRHRADLGHDRGGARPQRGAEKNRTSAKGR